MGRPKKAEAPTPEQLEARGAYRTNPNRKPKGKKLKSIKTRNTAAPSKDYAAIAERYARDVIAGKILSGEATRQACKRHLSDLAQSAKASYPFRFNAERANKFCALAERYPHIKGRWAGKGELLVLEPWQCFALAVPFGWEQKSDSLRRFREIYLQVARKNAKSTLAAAIGNNMLLADEEFGAEVYAGATTEKQAWEVFGPAKLMLQRKPELLKEFGAEVFARSITKPEDNSRFWPIIGKPGDGASPSCAIADEYHEHDTADLVDTMVTGMGAREQPMLVIITTSGTNLAAPCYDKYKESKKVLSGSLVNERLFVLIYELDEADDWSDPEMLGKANPNLGVSVDREFLLTQQRDAVTNSAYQNRFKTKHMNVWCGASVAGINMVDWDRCADAALRIERFKGEQAFGALDLASKIDICSYARLFMRVEKGLRHYYAFMRHYLPADTVAEARSNRQAYQKWVADKQLVAHDGAEVDFDAVRDDVLADARLYAFQSVAYDPWRAAQLAQQLRATNNITTIEVGQTARNMGAAFDELLTAVKSGRFHHDGDPVLKWMAANTIAKTVAKGLVVPSKDKPEQKIDGIVALVMAVGVAMASDATSQVMGWLTNPVTA